MPLDRRLAPAVVALLLLAAVGAAVVFTGAPRIRLSEGATAADRVTLYQDGIAFVELNRTFASPGGASVLVFGVPTTAVFDSLRLEGEGVAVRELRSSLAADPALRPGDRVAVHVDNGTWRGTVLAVEGDDLLLGTDDGTTLVRLSKVTAVTIEGRPVKDAGPGAAEVSAGVQAGPGNRTVRLTYLARGPGWSPAYTLDVDTGAFAFGATLTGLADWRNVSLDLVAGSPNLLAPSIPGPIPLRSIQAGVAEAALDARFAPSQPLGELHRYRLKGTVDLQRAETVRLPVVDGTVPILRHYFAADGSLGWGGGAGARQEVGVRERAEVRNTLPEPLMGGVVRFYREKTWIGDDQLPPTPVNDTANVTLAKAEEVDAQVTLESLQSTGSSDRYVYSLTVRNLRAQPGPIDLRATLTYPSFRTNLLNATPPPSEVLGTTLVWDAKVPQGGAVAFRVAYESFRDR